MVGYEHLDGDPHVYEVCFHLGDWQDMRTACFMVMARSPVDAWFTCVLSRLTEEERIAYQGQTTVYEVGPANTSISETIVFRGPYSALPTNPAQWKQWLFIFEEDRLASVKPWEPESGE